MRCYSKGAMYFSYSRYSRESAKRKYPIIGQVFDVDGVSWDIRDARGTKHGFDLYFGTPTEKHASYYGGLPRLIASQALYDFWDKNRTRGHGFLFDLPAGRTTLKRLRRRLGFNFDRDTEEFWTARLDDLKVMKPREFAEKHGVKRSNATDRRKAMIGRRARQLGWWRTPETIRLLLSDSTLRAVGDQLGIGTSQVFRLRRQILREITRTPIAA